MSELDSMDLAGMRREYCEGALRRSDLNKDPVEQFQLWLHDATESEEPDPTAMTLSTFNERGGISSRVVLLKGVDHTGFRFFTNLKSFKGRQIEKHPRVSLHFFWPSLARQVSIEGKAELLPRSVVAKYFSERPRESQLGAWASAQSEAVTSREALENAYHRCCDRFEGMEDLPVPPDWGGYSVSPDYYEFWQGRPGRLHDRFTFVSDKLGGWKITRLSP
jgi:pyridoxamine 5'-phosphate oxidase